MSDPAGIYLHIPFCRHKCRYCDFYSVEAPSKDEIDAYLCAMEKDLQARAAGETALFDSLFVGGGTPSIAGERLCRTIETALSAFSFAADTEVTVEANPESLTPAILAAWKQAGVNRISIGAQSLCDGELKDLGRIHRAERVFQVCREIREAGFDRFNVDLIFGIGHRECDLDPMTAFSQTLDGLLSIDPPHVSAYGLQIMDGTPLAQNRDCYAFPDEEQEDEMAALLCRRMRQAGYEHYEISNFAKPGYSCRHNLKYWRGAPYLGFGPSARSFWQGRRTGVSSDWRAYTAGKSRILLDETVDDREQAFEHLLLGLRLQEGVTFSSLQPFFKREDLDQRLAALQKAGYLHVKQDGFALTETGFRVSNAVIRELKKSMK